MSGDSYLREVLAAYSVERGPTSTTERAAKPLAAALKVRGGAALYGVAYSGSYAKGTGVSGTTDIDLFISLRSDTRGSLKDIYFSLVDLAQEKGWKPRPQNVSIRVTSQGKHIDLVPAKKHAGFQHRHSLYSRSRDSWLQTNVSVHVDAVIRSERAEEIRAMKVWRTLNSLEFPSFYLELGVIQALRGTRRGNLAANVSRALEWLSASIVGARLVDPANSNNVVSECIGAPAKRAVAAAAEASLRCRDWKEIIY
jgi:hypothetical protein